MPCVSLRGVVALAHLSRPALLPGPALQAEVAEQYRRQQERDHRGGQRRAFAQAPPEMARWKDSVAIRCVALSGPPRVST